MLLLGLTPLANLLLSVPHSSTISRNRISAEAEGRANMRTSLVVLVVLASLAVVWRSDAQSPTNPNFVTGFTPTKLNFQPMDMSKGVMPQNLQQGIMPQTMGPKVFNMSQAFHSFHMPSPIPVRPTSQSVIKPGSSNSPQIPKMQPSPATAAAAAAAGGN
jgi:hypothetical protein